MSVPAVETLGLGKRYGPVTALGSIDLAIAEGEYHVLLGPSGGGKTTLLRLIGGFARPTSGRVLLHGVDVGEVPPNRRPTSMVFQSYALFPHMTVEKNVGYGLRLLRLERAEIARKVAAMLALAGLEGYEKRMPHELSGGQQQRVQLARSLVLERDILLLDEPLAALDAQLRKDMCLELKRIQAEVGITFIHVTHNQEEAMTVADSIAIIADGELIEEGRPASIYEHPRRRFTARFLGESNVFDGSVAGIDGDLVNIDIGGATIAVPRGQHDPGLGQAVALSVRAERTRLRGDGERDGASWQSLPARFETTVYLGLTRAHRLRLADGREVVVREMADGAGGDPAAARDVAWRTEDGRLHLS